MQASLERLRQRRMERGEEGGFTLIELLIVIVILGILAAIVVFAVQNLAGQSAQASCKSDFKTVESATELYKTQMGQYPSGSNHAAGTVAVGASPNTDSDIGSPVGYTAGSAPVYAAPATGGVMVNAAGASTSELLIGGLTAPNTAAAGTNYGPWLKDVPSNTGHYSIFVANDGTGTIQVLDKSGNIAATASHTAADCSAIN